MERLNAIMAVISASRAGDCDEVKREYYTPYGKVRVKEYRCPAYGYYDPYYYGAPACGYGYYGPSYYYVNPYRQAPAYWGPSPYWGSCRVEIDD